MRVHKIPGATSITAPAGGGSEWGKTSSRGMALSDFVSKAKFLRTNAGSGMTLAADIQSRLRLGEHTGNPFRTEQSIRVADDFGRMFWPH